MKDGKIETLCPWQGMKPDEILAADKERVRDYLIMKSERAAKTGRKYREHVLDDQNALAFWLSDQDHKAALASTG